MQTVQDGGDEVLYGYWHMGFGGTQLQQNMLAHEWISQNPFTTPSLLHWSWVLKLTACCKQVTASWDETLKLWKVKEAICDHTFTGKGRL